MIDRLKLIMESKELNQRKFAILLGVSPVQV